MSGIESLKAGLKREIGNALSARQPQAALLGRNLLLGSAQIHILGE